MKENEQYRYIRWGIPGWMSLLALVSFVIVDIILSPASSKNSLVYVWIFLREGISLNLTASAAVALIIAAAGIPMGFVIYQVYFYIRWNSPFSRDGFFSPFIGGRLADLDRTMTGISPVDIVGNDKWRKIWTEDQLFNLDHGWKWRYIENLFIEITQYVDSKFSGASVNARYRYLMDLMHTLGAGLFGVYVGYLGYVLLKVKTDDISLSIIILASFASLFILLIFLEMEDKAKREKIDKKQRGKITHLVVKPIKAFGLYQLSNPSVIYLLFLFSVLYLGSPSPYTVIYTQSHLIFRAVVIAAILAVWWISISKLHKTVVFSEMVTLLCLAALGYMLSQWLRNNPAFLPEWWNIGWCILFFLAINLIFVKNRQNTRDDLIAMQNYTIKRYFSNSIKPFTPPEHETGKTMTPKVKKNNTRSKKQ